MLFGWELFWVACVYTRVLFHSFQHIHNNTSEWVSSFLDSSSFSQESSTVNTFSLALQITMQKSNLQIILLFTNWLLRSLVSPLFYSKTFIAKKSPNWSHVNLKQSHHEIFTLLSLSLFFLLSNSIADLGKELTYQLKLSSSDGSKIEFYLYCFNFGLGLNLFAGEAGPPRGYHLTSSTKLADKDGWERMSWRWGVAGLSVKLVVI